MQIDPLLGCVREGFAFLSVGEIIEKKSAMDIKGKPANIYLFNCDSTCSLDPIEYLLLNVQNEVKIWFTVNKHNFRLREMSEMSGTVIPALKWILPFLLFIPTNHVSQSTQTTLELVTQVSTELYRERLVSRVFCIRSLQSDNDTLYPFYDDEYSEEVKCLLSCRINKRFIESAIVAVWHS